MTVHTYFIELSSNECARLLAESVVGRLGVVVDGRPEIFPVSHVYSDTRGTVLFPTNEQTKWHAALAWPWVAFEVDGVEPDHTQGWSVAIVGSAAEVTDPDIVEAATQQRAPVWCLGPGTRWLEITPSKMTGVRVMQP
jgi:nitroimidazol reductase NimA-like FMN-containing flavoprotein (pyridoxamine 5'-phosphate oxidase superfamily)